MLRYILRAVPEGIVEGVHQALNPYYDPQEYARRRLISHNNDPAISDPLIFLEFRNYCTKYDRALRLTQTVAMLKAILRRRPSLEKVI